MIRPVQKDLYAVIGNPVAHSLSPVMMNAVFEALHVSAVYLALQVDDLEQDLATLAELGVQGLSVTIPHKEAACRLADPADEPTRLMGAVNTLRLKGSRWEGCNTDWIGGLSALSHAMHQPTIERSLTPSALHAFKNRRVLLIGAGGVARAVGYGLNREGAALSVTNRGVTRGEALARTLDCEFLPLSELGRQGGGMVFDIVVQCTSLGLGDEEEFTLIPDSLFRPGTVAMDTIYRPLWTPFLRKARAARCITVPGVEMLLRQGVAQLTWWFGELIQAETVLPIMREALHGILTDEEDNQKTFRRT